MTKIRSISAFVIALLSIAIISSCTEDTTINTKNSGYVPVISGTITNQEVRQQIQVSSSSGYFDKEVNKRIANAVVTIKDRIILTVYLHSGKSEERKEPYHRMDISASYHPHKHPKRWYQGEWVFSVYNVYWHKNPWMTSFDQNTADGYPQAKMTYLYWSIFHHPANHLQ